MNNVTVRYYTLTIGERYRIVPPRIYTQIGETVFYGTCHRITSVPIYERFIKVQFINLTDQFHEPLPENKTMVVDLITAHPSDYGFMKLMDYELTCEIKRHKKMEIPSLANLCRKLISYETRVEYQGTFINDLINNDVGKQLNYS
jgi:hypothetical protein